MLAPHPEDAAPRDGATFLDCDVAGAVRIGLDAADGTHLHVLPRLLGDGTRPSDVAGESMRKLQHLGRR